MKYCIISTWKGLYLFVFISVLLNKIMGHESEALEIFIELFGSKYFWGLNRCHEYAGQWKH